MIKCEINKGNGDIEIQGEWQELLTDIAFIAVHSINALAKNENGFEELKDIFIEGIKNTSYDEVQEG